MFALKFLKKSFYSGVFGWLDSKKTKNRLLMSLKTYLNALSQINEFDTFTHTIQ